MSTLVGEDGSRPTPCGPATRWVQILAIALVGLALSFMAWGVLRRYETDTVRQRFVTRAREVLGHLEASLQEHTLLLNTMAGYHRIRGATSRRDFHAFVAPLMEKARSIRAVEWIPRVPGDQRDDFERSAQQEGLTGFQITERNASGQLVRAGTRDVYYPVLQVEPLEGNQPALGYDLGSESMRREALTQAARTGQNRATGRVHLVQDPGDEYGTLLFVPVHDIAAEKANPSDPATLRGFLLGVFNIEELVGRALSRGETPELDLVLEDDSAAPSERLLGRFAGGLGPDGQVQPAAAPSQEAGWLTVEQRMTFGGRTWVVRAVARQGFVHGLHTHTPLLALLLGLIVTTVMSGGYLLWNRQLARSERLVAERTREASLSQWYLRAILDNQPNLAWLKDMDGRFLAVNDMFARATGRTAEHEIVGRTDAEVWPARLAALYQADDREVLESGLPKTVEEPIAEPGGTRWFETFKTPVLASDGTPIGTTGIARDVTERKQAAQALAEALELNTKIVDAISLGVVAWDEDGKCVLANEAVAGMLGGSREQVLAQNFRQISAWAESGLLAVAEEALATQSYREFDLRTTSTFGVDVWLNCRFTTFARQGRKHLLLITDDVGAQRKAEAELRWNEALLSQMAAASPLGFLVVDNRTDAILYSNDRFCEIWGLQELREQLRAGAFKNNDIIPHCIPRLGDVEAFAASCKPLQDEENRVVIEDEIPISDGRTIRRFSAQIRDDEDNYLGRFYLFEDITQRKQEAHFLAQQTALLIGLRDSIPDLVFFKDLEGVYLGCNPPFARLVGHPQEEITGSTDYNLFPHEVADFFREQDRATLAQGTPRHNDEWVVYPDGERSFIDTYKAPLMGEGGKVIGLVGISRDITTKALAEAALREATTAAVEANAAKSEFLANMSHEIRSPMNGIIGAADLLLETSLSPEQHELAGIIKLSAGSLLSLINDILDLSKIEARRLEIERIPFDLHSVAEETVDMMALPAAEKGLDLVSHLDARASVRVVGDPARLRQVLLNLVNNAVKFTLAGEVSVSMRCEARTDTELTARFEIRDTGIGIPREKLETIFDAFTQVEASTTRRFGGTGLGLTIVRKLVEGMGGVIGVESTVDKGSLFWFTLPLPLAAPAAAPEGSGTAKDGQPASAVPENRWTGRPRRLLIAEDNRVNQIILKKIVLNLGLSADVAENGREVIHTLLRDPAYDLILMDVQMPVLDGLEATRQIRAGEAGEALSQMPIIALTANAMVRDQHACLEAGMNDYLSKPVEGSRLLERLRHWLPEPAPEARPERREPILFDPEALSELLGRDEVVLGEALQEFVQDLESRRARLAEQVSTRAFFPVRRDAHAIKGAASYIQSRTLREIALVLERVAANEDPVKLEKAYRKFDTISAEVLREVSEWLRERGLHPDQSTQVNRG